MARRRQRGLVKTTSPSPSLFGSPTTTKKKKFSYTIELKPDTEDEDVINALLVKLKNLELGLVVWKPESFVARENSFGEKNISAAFSTEDKTDADKIEDLIEDWDNVSDIAVTRSVVEFKISATTPVTNTTIPPVSKTNNTSHEVVKPPSISRIQSSSQIIPGLNRQRSRTRVRAPSSPAHAQKLEVQRRKKEKAAKKQERSEALELLQVKK